jgi:hypothetical protein
VHDEADPTQIEPFDEPQQRVVVEAKRVRPRIGRLVGPPVAEQIRHDDTGSLLEKDRDHLAIEEAPRRGAVQAQEEVTRIARPFVDVGETQALESAQVVDELRRVVEAADCGECLIGRANDFDTLHGRGYGIEALAPLRARHNGAVRAVIRSSSRGAGRRGLYELTDFTVTTTDSELRCTSVCD